MLQSVFMNAVFLGYMNDYVIHDHVGRVILELMDKLAILCIVVIVLN